MKIADRDFGYWPSSIFSILSDSASTVQWGGEVINLMQDGQHTTTQMGSGHFPEEGLGKASFFKNLNVIDGLKTLTGPRNSQTIITNPTCYNLINSGDSFYFGGPGRNPNCPWSFRLLFQNKEKEGNIWRGESFSCFLHVTPNVPKSHMSYETLLFNNIKKVILWSGKI